MNKALLLSLALTLGSGVFLLGCGDDGEGSSGLHPRVSEILALSGDVAGGQAVYEDSMIGGCGGCHGASGEGVMNVGPALAPRVAPITNEQIADSLMKGIDPGDPLPMPSYESLSNQQAADLIAYLRANFNSAASDAGTTTDGS